MPAQFELRYCTNSHKCAGIHVIARNGTEVFIPQSLLTFDMPYLTADETAIPPLASTPGPSGVMTLLCELFEFQPHPVHFVDE
jgi:peptidoglycan/xylan/chitin deacetylase (PgdA/CDA1 family)